MEFRQFEVFRMIAQELHFGRAAQRLFIAQPSVSQQLRKLEAELGVRLVHRTSRSVSLTPAGKVFLAEIEKISAASERAVMLARQAAAGRHGTLRIASNYPASRLLLIPLLSELRQNDPGLSTILREMGTPDQLLALSRGDLDLGLLYGPVQAPGIETRHLIDVPVVATVRKGHPLGKARKLSYSRILDFPHLTGFAGGSSVIEDAVVRTATEHGVRLKRASGTTDLTGYLLELETTDAIGFSSLPRGEQNRAIGLRLLRLEPVEPMLEIHVAWNSRNDEGSMNSLMDALSRLAEDLTARA